MSLTRLRDAAALLIALGAAIASLVVWDYGTVNLGLTLGQDGERVYVQDVTPDGNAHRLGWYPGQPILDLTTVDGSPVARGEPIRDELVRGREEIRASDPYFELENVPDLDEMFPYELYGSYGGALLTLDLDHRRPTQAINSERIATAVAGSVDPGWGEVYDLATIQRDVLELQLENSIWITALGLLLGIVVWRVLAHGAAGDIGRRYALPVGAGFAVPALIYPVVQAGAAPGIAAGYLVPVAAATVLGAGMAADHSDLGWMKTGMAASVAAAGLAVLVVARNLTGPVLSPDRATILLLIAAIALVPALIAAINPQRTPRERGALLSLAAMPAAGVTITALNNPDLWVPVTLGTLLLGWQLLPMERFATVAGPWASSVRAQAAMASIVEVDRGQAATRDLVAYVLLGGAVFLNLAAPAVGPAVDGAPFFGTSAVVFGLGVAALVGFAVRRALLGPDWTDAAAPLAAAVGVPIILAIHTSNGPGLAALPTALAALTVAHAISLRHPDPAWRVKLLGTSAAIVALVILLVIAMGYASTGVVVPLIALVALIPALPIAFADVSGEARAITVKLETLAVALTPGIASTMLAPFIGIVVLAVWLVAIVVWRRFTFAPLLGLAQRTQLQRDLAVAAAETERARLAADLHDDALQQLTMLVRKLDEEGQTDAANEAREVATKLRSVVGDLRLPILDDLGAGAALEWLVERVEPLAGGPVKLERSDETRPPANVELAVFRVAQEALTNAIKHGRPPIAVRYDVRTDGRVTLAIDDAGEGIPGEAAEEAPRAGHFGLANMQQRAEQIGALLDVRRWPAGGTRVALEWRPQ